MPAQRLCLNSGMPVIAVGGIGIDRPSTLDLFSRHITSNPESVEMVEHYLRKDEMDLVAVGRALLADPDWPEKIELNRLDTIIPFTSDTLNKGG